MPCQLQLTFSIAGRSALPRKTAAKVLRTARTSAKHNAVTCSACKPVTTLPNGLQVCYASKYDVSFLYREIFQEQTYLQQGVQLAQGDVVVDIGGNIGFFALFAAQQVGPQGKVISLEPIPPLHNKLTYNVRSHHAWCQAKGMPVADIVPVPMGVGSGQAATMDFTYFTAAAGWSTMYPDDEEVQGAMQIFLAHSLSTLKGIDSSFLTSAGQLLQSAAPKWLSNRVERLFVQNMLRQRETHTCQMTTVSDTLRQQGLSGISLLKIDVERAELDVLHGIDELHWPCIDQVVLEVHDIDDRLHQVTNLLRHKAGFTSITTTQDDQLKGSTLFNIYCHRNDTDPKLKLETGTSYTPEMQQQSLQN